jgi:hypothetical protein
MCELQDEQEQRRGVHEQAERGVRSWLQLSSQTLQMIGFLTHDAPEPFLDPVRVCTHQIISGCMCSIWASV